MRGSCEALWVTGRNHWEFQEGDNVICVHVEKASLAAGWRMVGNTGGREGDTRQEALRSQLSRGEVTAWSDHTHAFSRAAPARPRRQKGRLTWKLSFNKANADEVSFACSLLIYSGGFNCSLRGQNTISKTNTNGHL